MCAVEWAQWWSKCMFLTVSHYSPHPQRTDYHHPQSVSVTTAISHPWDQWNFQRVSSSPLVFCLLTCVMAEGGGGGGGEAGCMNDLFLKIIFQKGDKSLSSGLSVLHTRLRTHTRYLSVIAHTGGLIRRSSDVSALQLASADSPAQRSGRFRRGGGDLPGWSKSQPKCKANSDHGLSGP